MPRPLTRKRGGYGRIYVGRPRYCLPDYYTHLHTAATAAAKIRPTRKGNT